VSFYIRESRNKGFSFLRKESKGFEFQGSEDAGLACLPHETVVRAVVLHSLTRDECPTLQIAKTLSSSVN
jgi:hypothetical protein